MAWAAANEAVRHWSDVAVVHTTRLRYYRMAWVGGTERASLGARAADGRRRRVSGRLAGVAPRQASRWWQVGAMGLTKGRMHYSTILASGTTTRWPEGTARSHQVRSGCGRDGRWPDRYDSVQCVLVPSACTQPRPALPRTMPSGRQRVVVGAMWSLVVRYYHTTYTTTPLRYLPTLVEWYHTTSKVKDYAPPELWMPTTHTLISTAGGDRKGAAQVSSSPRHEPDAGRPRREPHHLASLGCHLTCRRVGTRQPRGQVKGVGGPATNSPTLARPPRQQHAILGAPMTSTRGEEGEMAEEHQMEAGAPMEPTAGSHLPCPGRDWPRAERARTR